MTQEELDALLAQVIEEARAQKIPVSASIQPHVGVNTRCKLWFGRCSWRMGGFYIEVARRMLDAPPKALCQTLAHEVLHTCPGCVNHGKRWKAYAGRMNQAYGYDIRRTNTAEQLGVEQIPARYVVVCQSCGAQFRRTRRTELVEHPENYRCHCNGPLKLEEENW